MRAKFSDGNDEALEPEESPQLTVFVFKENIWNRYIEPEKEKLTCEDIEPRAHMIDKITVEDDWGKL